MLGSATIGEVTWTIQQSHAGYYHPICPGVVVYVTQRQSPKERDGRIASRLGAEQSYRNNNLA